MISKNKVLITFDYELFQGKRSGKVENCLLKPTANILRILQKHKATAVFFVDMMHLCRLKDEARRHADAQRDLGLIEEQIIEMAQQGHYVFNHLHPHWLDAVYSEEKNEWLLENTRKYTFQSLSEEERENVFQLSMNLLNEILAKSSRHFPSDGYRAGGLFIQPFSSFKKHFDKYGIRHEFSILKNAKGVLEMGEVSFNNAGVTKNIYTFSENITEEDSKGIYTEYALEFVQMPVVTRLLNSVFYRVFKRKSNHKKYGDGIPTANKMSSTEGRKFTSTETFSVEMLNNIKLPVYIKLVKEKHYLHMLSHPKLVSEYNLKVFDKFLGKLNTSANPEYDFKKFDIG